MLFRQLFDPETSTYTYLLADEETRQAVLIDPVRGQLDRDVTLLQELGLELVFVLDTHVHADHVTAAGQLRRKLGAKTVVAKSANVMCADFRADDGDVIPFGSRSLEVRLTPGHTDGDATYVLDDRSMAFTGDTLLIRGCGRTDFQAGDSRALYRSVWKKIFSLPDSTLIYPGHDYKGRTCSSVGEEKRHNPRLGGGKSEDELVEIMAQLRLAYPKHIDAALPANNQCGLTPVDEVDEVVMPPSWAPLVRTAAGIPEVSAEWVRGSRKAGAYRLVDVRGDHEYNGELGHIQGSELVPLESLVEAASKWDPAERLVIVCRSGGRSGSAAQTLEAMGFQAVASMAGGMLAWNALSSGRSLQTGS